MTRNLMLSVVAVLGGIAFSPATASADHYYYRSGGYRPYVRYSSCYSSPVRYASYSRPAYVSYASTYSDYDYEPAYYAPSYSASVVYSAPVVRYARPVVYTPSYSYRSYRPAYVSHRSYSPSRYYGGHYRSSGFSAGYGYSRGGHHRGHGGGFSVRF